VSFEGCTPGYWKQPQHFDSWSATGYSPNQTLESVLNVPDAYGWDNVSLVQALNFKGGPDTTGAAGILLRTAVAALLNAAHPDVDYPLTTAQVIDMVNAALATGSRSAMLEVASLLDSYNNAGCPLNGGSQATVMLEVSGDRSPGSSLEFKASVAVDFTDEGATYRWDFGDGTPATGPTASDTISHSYMKVGRYTARVAATNELGTTVVASRAVLVGQAIFLPTVLR
jgi:hypothetical protein